MIEDTYSIAWADFDSDGDLDLAVGNFGQENRIYRNDAGTLVSVWVSAERDSTQGVAWADFDSDGDADLAVGNGLSSGAGEPNRLYRNDGGGVFTLAWTSTEIDNTTCIAWGDWDNDGDPDLAVGNTGLPPLEPDRVYRNDSGSLSLAWTSVEQEATGAVAWGDLNGDGILDLVTGTTSWPTPQTKRVYRGDGLGGLTPNWACSEILDKTFAVALADVDRDGDLDLATGNSDAPAGMPNRLYLNDSTGNLTLAWTSTESDPTDSLDWGDWDGDGDLDLAVGNRPAFINRVYRNEGGTLELAWCSGERDTTYSVAWGDVDGDGDLDLAAGNAGEPSRIYINDQAPCFTRSLGKRILLQAIKNGTGGATFSWLADAATLEYHVNSVGAKTELVDPMPYRPSRVGGIGTAQCEAFPPSTSCTDPDALSGLPLLFYQVVSACGPCGELEGPL